MPIHFVMGDPKQGIMPPNRKRLRQELAERVDAVTQAREAVSVAAHKADKEAK